MHMKLQYIKYRHSRYLLDSTLSIILYYWYGNRLLYGTLLTASCTAAATLLTLPEHTW